MMPLLITLTENKIGAAGATQLADALQRNSTLTTLDLFCKHDIIYALFVIIFNVINICDTYCFLFINSFCFVFFIIRLFFVYFLFMFSHNFYCRYFFI